MKKRALSLLALAFLALQTMSPALAQSENAKWFVVRNETTGACWIALLVQINGQYPHAGALLAGGPYDTQDEATKRREELEVVGTCQSKA